MADVYCPSCTSPMVVTVGAIMHFRLGGFSLVYEGFVICTGCPLVSQVDRTTGLLIDLGGLTLSDVQEPYVPGQDPAPYLTQQPTRLLGRRDS